MSSNKKIPLQKQYHGWALLLCPLQHRVMPGHSILVFSLIYICSSLFQNEGIYGNNTQVDTSMAGV